MEYDKPIADMIPGDEAEGFYILKDAHQKTTAAGKPFLSGSIADRSGSMDIKVWDYSAQPHNLLGQVCLPFAVWWAVLAGAAVILDDLLRFALFGEAFALPRLF